MGSATPSPKSQALTTTAVSRYSAATAALGG